MPDLSARRASSGAPSSDRENAGLLTYSDTVARGLYDRTVGGLRGKYDNVRTYWEDRLTRATVGGFLGAAGRTADAGTRGVRILDLGCGAGQGYELLTRITETGLNLGDTMRFVLPADRVELYLGLDLSEAMVSQGRKNYERVAQVRFEQADLREGLPRVVSDQPSFDVYFSSYGALSHLDDADLVRCLTDVVRHAAHGSLAVLDLLGRYSPEWPGYWHAATSEEKRRPYSMSYLYNEAERAHGHVERFPLRFWTGEEVRELCRELTGRTGVLVEAAHLLDRSVLVGRHVDTREFGCVLPPLRGLVNRLYEQNLRTELGLLRVNYQPSSGIEAVDRFLATHCASWNVLVDFTLERLTGTRVDLVALEGWSDFPPPLQLALMTMDRIVDSVAWIDVGDTRANIVEPQLAYVLQRLEHALQRGLGCGHGLVAVLRVAGRA